MNEELRSTTGAPSTTPSTSEIRDEELARLGGAGEGRLADAVEVLDSLVLTDDPPEFLTHPAYSRLD